MLNKQPGPPRGILHPRLELGDAEHLRIAPPASLAGWVEHFWSVRWDLAGRAPQVQESLPHPNVHLAVEAGRSAVLGVHTGRFTRVLEGRGRVFGVKFRPGGAGAGAGLLRPGPFHQRLQEAGRPRPG